MPEDYSMRSGKMSVPFALVITCGIAWAAWVSVQVMDIRESIAGLKALSRQSTGIVSTP